MHQITEYKSSERNNRNFDRVCSHIHDHDSGRLIYINSKPNGICKWFFTEHNVFRTKFAFIKKFKECTFFYIGNVCRYCDKKFCILYSSFQFFLNIIKNHGLQKIVICDHSRRNRKRNVYAFRCFFIHCIGIITIRINLRFVDNGNGVFFRYHFSTGFTEYFKITCTEVNTINIVTHCLLPFLVL